MIKNLRKVIFIEIICMCIICGNYFGIMVISAAEITPVPNRTAAEDLSENVQSKDEITEENKDMVNLENNDENTADDKIVREIRPSDTAFVSVELIKETGDNNSGKFTLDFNLGDEAVDGVEELALADVFCIEGLDFSLSLEKLNESRVEFELSGLENKKYKYYIKFNPNFSDNYSRNIMNLLGVSRDFIEFTHLNWHKIFYHLGIIQSGIRTKEALTSIIQHYFDLHDISLEEHVRKIVEVEVEQKNQVGIKNVMLGENFILGDKVESFSNKFRVNINNLKLDEFHQFLPNTKKYRHLQELIRFLLKDPLPYDVLLGLHPDTKSTFILGKDNSSFLGWTTLININSGKSQSLNQIIIEGAS